MPSPSLDPTATITPARYEKPSVRLEQSIDSLRRRSVVVVHPSSLEFITRFPMKSLINPARWTDPTALVGPEDISWASFWEKLVSVAAAAGIERIIGAGTRPFTLDLFDEDSLESTLAQYMAGKHQDDMGNILVFPQSA